MMKKYKILLVDDSSDWLKAHSKMLDELYTKELFDIHTATSGKQGFLKVLQEQDFNLVITDLEMEKLFDEPYAGSWLVKNLISREEFKNTKFLIISGAYNIWDVANSLKVQHIAKSSLIDNPMTLMYKINELLNLTI